MFKEWGFLLGEVWFLLLLAALLGLLAGWIIWSRRSTQVDINEHQELKKRCADLEGNLSECKTRNGKLSTQLAECEKRYLALKSEPAKPAPLVSATPAAVAAPAPASAPKPAPVKKEEKRPEALTAPIAGKADDLKQIKGIGVKLEKLCNKLGFYHFDQIAKWTNQEVSWVDENLEGFKGRVTRDEWVKQAKILAKGGATEFSKRVEKGDVDY